MKKCIVIGSGFAGLASACYLAKDGFNVRLVEKNESLGGRASQFKVDGFTFDMGPSWYWMPDVFDSFFADFGKKTSDYYELERLSPGYRVFFDKEDIVDVPATLEDLYTLFEKEEKGAAEKLQAFLKDAAYKYDRGINDLVKKPSLSIFEFTSPLLLKDLFNLQLFSSVESTVRKRFKSDKLRKILEFPAYFLGATPDKIPALYTLMNHADLTLGTWYPKNGGMHNIIKAMVSLAKELGVEISCDTTVEKINIKNGEVQSISTNKGEIEADYIVAAGDYHHTEQQLIEKKYRNYDEKYWDKQTLAPSALIYYLGVNKKIDNLLHHNLFFDEDFAAFGEDIYENPKWPEKPLFYVCSPSKTDKTVAPKGNENIFILIPVAPNLEDGEDVYDKYFDILIKKLETYTNTSIKEHIVYKRAFAHQHFKERYNAYKGNAYGLANTLMQTAFLKPKLVNPNIKNMVYAGQLTVPGPGVPPSLISGKLAANYLRTISK